MAAALVLGAATARTEAVQPSAATEAAADAALAAGHYAQAAVARLDLFERTKDPVHLERAARAFMAVGTPVARQEAARILRQYLGLEQDAARRAEAERLLGQAEAGPPPAAASATASFTPAATISGPPTYYYATPSGWAPGYGPAPLPAPEQKPETEMNSPATLGIGVTLLGCGFIAAIAGGMVALSTAIAGCEDSKDPDCHSNNESTATKGGIAAAVGGVSVLVGVGLIVVGAVPVEVEKSKKPPMASAAPEVGIGPGAVRLGWHF